MLAALSTGHKIGLGGSALIFIAFALLSAMAIPRRRPDFPARALPAFVIATLTLFVGMLAAVEIFGAEAKEKEARAEKPPAAAAPSAADVARGKSLYASLGCQSCHTLTGAKSVGPSFKGLAGSSVKLTDGTTVAADEAYLTQSIEDPNAKIVAGFGPGVMASVIKPGSVADADAKALVAFIQSVR